MNRGLILLMSIVVSLVGARAQQNSPRVHIQLGGSLNVATPFAVQLSNDLTVPITFCADFGKSILTTSGRRVAADPFEHQKWNGKLWNTQLIGTDIGQSNAIITVNAHESKSFTLHITAPGRYRLKLIYIEGESDAECPLPSGRATTISSKPFSIHAIAQK